MDAVDVVFDGVIPYDVRFFESLSRMVQAEPWLERDRAMIDPLKSIGIEQGKPFKRLVRTAFMPAVPELYAESRPDRSRLAQRDPLVVLRAAREQNERAGDQGRAEA